MSTHHLPQFKLFKWMCTDLVMDDDDDDDDENDDDDDDDDDEEYDDVLRDEGRMGKTFHLLLVKVGSRMKID